MNVKQLKEAVMFLSTIKKPAFVWGKHGTGKTEIMKQLAVEHFEGNMIHLLLATQEEGDLLGLPKETENGKSGHMTPSWWPEEGTKGILFLDEFNRAQTSVIQCMFNLLNEGKYEGRELPQGWVVHAAGNYDNDQYITTNIKDDALLSRFCHINFQPEVREWIEFAKSKEYHPMVVSFYEQHQELLEQVAEMDITGANGFVKPNRRANWIADQTLKALDKKQLSNNVARGIISGVLGDVVCFQMMNHYEEENKKIVSYEEIITNYPKEKVLDLVKNNRTDVLTLYTTNIIESLKDGKITEEQMPNVRKFTQDIPDEIYHSFGYYFIYNLNYIEKHQVNINLLLKDISFAKELKERNKRVKFFEVSKEG